MRASLLGLLALLAVPGCRPAPASASVAARAALTVLTCPFAACLADRTAAPRVTVETVRIAAGSFRVRAYLRYGNDGNGAADSIVVSLWVNPTGAPTQQHRLPATVTKDSFTVASAGIGVAMSGSVKVFPIRRGLAGSETVALWTYTEADQPPPPVIIDSLRVSALEVVPGTVALYFGESKQFCALLTFATGQRALIGGQRGLGPCDQAEGSLPPLERATSAQYAVAATYASCALEADGVKRCRLANGSIVVVA